MSFNSIVLQALLDLSDGSLALFANLSHVQLFGVTLAQIPPRLLWPVFGLEELYIAQCVFTILPTSFFLSSTGLKKL
jgi:hypothetical protein